MTAQKSSEFTGFFDLQMNGFGGVDYQQESMERADLRRSVDKLLEHGTGRILLTLVTDTIEAFYRKLEKIESFRRDDDVIRRVVVGYHIEGPYMSEKLGFRGAHPAAHMKDPCVEEFVRMQDAANGNIRLITIAPERNGSEEFIRYVTGQKVVVSLGHTDASEKEIDLAIQAGATLCTHLGNGCPSLLHRHDNIIHRLLARDELIACFIPDGIHIPFDTLKNFLRIKPADKILFTTDCMAAAGMPAGRYTIGHHLVEVGDDRVVRQPGQDNFAGSSLAPDEGVRNLIQRVGLAPGEAHEAFSSRVAAALGFPQ